MINLESGETRLPDNNACSRAAKINQRNGSTEKGAV